MTSERKIKTNRPNSRASTGQKTARGRSHAAQNAIRHGLSRPVHSDPGFSGEVEALAQEIAGTKDSEEIHELAYRIAEAGIEGRRVRHARHQLFSEALSDTAASEELQRNQSLPVTYANQKVPDMLATILSEKARQLFALERYERRALSRARWAETASDLLRAVVGHSIFTISADFRG